MNRRSFLAGILAACAAPAIVRADSLMRIVPMDAPILLGDYDVLVETGRPLLDINAIRAAVLRIAHDQRAFIDSRNLFDQMYGDKAFSTATLRIRMPNAYKVRA